MPDTLDTLGTRAGGGQVRSRRPTNKWLAAQVTAVGALATMYLTTHGWDVEESVALVGLVTQALVTYLVPNADTPGGVPLRSPRA